MRKLPLLILLLAVVALTAWFALRDPGEERAAVADTDTSPHAEASRDGAALETAALSEPTRVTAEHGRPDTTAELVLEGVVVAASAGVPPDAARPAAGAVVIAHCSTRGFTTTVERSSPTDDEGRFRIVVADPGERPIVWRVRVEGDDRYRHADDEARFDDDVARVDGLLLVRREHAGIEGTVEDPMGAPVAGATVELGPHRTVSDLHGAFQLPTLAPGTELRPSKPGWIVLHVSAPRRAGEGTWKPFDVVMTPTAALRVTVTDSDGGPVVGEPVRVDVSPAEPFGTSDTGWQQFAPPVLTSKTEAEGRVAFEAVPALQRLRVRIRRHEYEHEAHDGTGTLLLRDAAVDAGARPLTLREGDRRELRVVLGSRVTLRGRVLEPDGSPSPAARITTRALNADRLERPPTPGETRADDEGRFALELVAPRDAQRLLVVAQGTIGEEPPKGMFGGRKLPDPLHATWTLVELPESGAVVGELVLRLEPMAKLAGSVVDATGAGIAKARVRAHPLQDDLLPDVLPTTTRRRTRADGDGLFRLVGVPPGRYELEVTSDDHGTVWLRGVEAGREDLVVRFAEPRVANVRIEIESDVALDKVIVLRGRLEPYGDDADGLPMLPASATYEQPLGWPEPALGLWYGSQAWRGRRGEANFASWPIDGRSTDVTVAPGPWWFGAKASTVDGGRCFPIGTGLVRVGEGHYVLRFRLAPTGRIEGRVIGDIAGRSLCVAVALGDGRLIPLNVRRHELTAFADVSAGGRFVLRRVPSGVLELRVGTASELRAGGALVSRPVDVRPGETLELELVL